MARPLRIEYEGALYHVTARGNELRKIYFAKADYERFMEGDGGSGLHFTKKCDRKRSQEDRKGQILNIKC